MISAKEERLHRFYIQASAPFSISIERGEITQKGGEIAQKGGEIAPWKISAIQIVSLGMVSFS